LQQKSGAATAKSVGVGKAISAFETRSSCAEAQKDSRDRGYPDIYRGWYDVHGCGECNDYCRWVGPDAADGSGGDPSLKLSHLSSWWSCRLAGSEDPYTPPDHFESWSLKRCSYRGQKSCYPAQQEINDGGYQDEFAGWYDVQGCGSCNDYCRWIGRSGSGGDPVNALTFGTSYWSCSLAGASFENTPQGFFKAWGHSKCKTKQEEKCMRRSFSEHDDGYVDHFRGWYDVQGCGTCNDYCRWVGKTGSGGDPSVQVEKGKSWWSCRLAGTDDHYTPLGYFQAFNYTRCDHGAGQIAAEVAHAGVVSAKSEGAGIVEARFEEIGQQPQDAALVQDVPHWYDF